MRRRRHHITALFFAGIAAAIIFALAGDAAKPPQCRPNEPCPPTITTAPTTTTTTPTEPAPIAGQGYTEVFRDDFNSWDTTVWCNKLWWQRYAALADEIFVSNGVLVTQTFRNRSDELDAQYPNKNANTCNKKSWQYGYMETRMKPTAGNGSWPAWWLISSANAYNPNYPNPPCPLPGCLSFELDMFEGVGNLNLPHRFTGGTHRNTGGAFGVPDSSTCGQVVDVPEDLYAGFNKYAVIWDASTIKFILNDRVLFSCPTDDSGHQQEFMVLSTQAQENYWGNGMVPADASTPSPLRIEWDYVSVWQR
jgi:beta-glucanase (GH16 family)